MQCDGPELGYPICGNFTMSFSSQASQDSFKSIIKRVKGKTQSNFLYLMAWKEAMSKNFFKSFFENQSQ